MEIKTRKSRFGAVGVLVSILLALGNFNAAQAKHEGRHDNGRHLGWYKQQGAERRAFNRQRQRTQDWRQAYYRERAQSQARAQRQRVWRNRVKSNYQRRNTWRRPTTVYRYYPAPTYRWRSGYTRNPYTPLVGNGYRLVDSDYLTTLESARQDAEIAKSNGYYVTWNWDPTVNRYIVRKYVRRY